MILPDEHCHLGLSTSERSLPLAAVAIGSGATSEPLWSEFDL